LVLFDRWILSTAAPAACKYPQFNRRVKVAYNAKNLTLKLSFLLCSFSILIECSFLRTHPGLSCDQNNVMYSCFLLKFPKFERKWKKIFK
jgi:hypothetical protein